jgi:E3 ubiquitin-protein ligase HECTD1
VAQIERACDKQCSRKDNSNWKLNLETALRELTVLLKDEKSVSAYEIHSSGLVQALLRLFAKNRRKFSWTNSNSCDKLLSERLDIFKSIIGVESTATALIRYSHFF